jgi:hypothetical protein
MSAGPLEDSAVHTHQTSPFAVVYGSLYSHFQSCFISMEQAADQLGIGFVTARAWHSKGTFPLETVTLGSRRLVSLASLAAFVVRGDGLASTQGTNTTDTNQPPLLPPVEPASEPAAEQEQPTPQKRKPGRPRKAVAASGKGVCHG